MATQVTSSLCPQRVKSEVVGRGFLFTFPPSVSRVDAEVPNTHTRIVPSRDPVKRRGPEGLQWDALEIAMHVTIAWCMGATCVREGRPSSTEYTDTSPPGWPPHKTNFDCFLSITMNKFHQPAPPHLLCGPIHISLSTVTVPVDSIPLNPLAIPFAISMVDLPFVSLLRNDACLTFNVNGSPSAGALPSHIQTRMSPSLFTSTNVSFSQRI
mmetsp:Transcript_41804/g.65297  ORF Transcript_41804/g.65297 Transcript_41804/m.65297 type:complete len:211 (-) Transcript_41804:651-1283(-)